MQVLACDISGIPFDWISSNDAATYHASQKVAWDIGDIARVYRGGSNARKVNIAYAILNFTKAQNSLQC